ncbi:unnamed protein product [Arctia plantaginis]|nr:unnamed protein product [Arctia plantaginis]
MKQIVSSFYCNGEYPSTAKILSRAVERIDGFQCSISSMRKILIELGYKYTQAPDGRKQLMERTDIVCARLQFLRKLKTLRDSEDTRPRIYLDDLVCHAGCAKYGFIPEARWVFRAVKSQNEDYHSEMNAKGFTHWFTKLLQSLEEPSVITMDNAPYHSQQINRAPTSANKKSEIQEWLREHGIELSDSELKPDLLQKVQRNRPEKIYELDQLALESGHEVIRLPPYHCQYNPIELVWAQAKNEVASKNTTFKIADVEVLLHEAISIVSQKNWEDCVKHAEKLQEEDLKKSHLAEEFVIHVDDDDSDDSDVEF